LKPDAEFTDTDPDFKGTITLFLDEPVRTAGLLLHELKLPFNIGLLLTGVFFTIVQGTSLLFLA